MPNAASPQEPRLGGRGLGRVPALILLGVLMILILAGVLWVSGMTRDPGHPDVGAPTYRLPDNRPSDAAAR
jgi:hypothetical protein